nr:MAG TPA: hypothetical protein [Caudoviricetes sp.]
MTHIYNERLEYIIGLNYDYEDFKKNPVLYYPDWKNTYYASPTKYEYPIIDVDDVIREMTREEKILQLGMEDLLEDGEYIENGKIIKVEYDEKLGYLKRAWNKETHVWYEGATEEELKEKYYQLINDFKNEILETGYIFIDATEKKHEQKCRDKDLALLGNAIAAQEDIAAFSQKIDLKTLWAFNDGDTLEMTLQELKKLRLQGAMFVQVVFTIEAQLKAQASNVKFTKVDFIKLINDNSDVKCWEENLSDTTDKTSKK